MRSCCPSCEVGRDLRSPESFLKVSPILARCAQEDCHLIERDTRFSFSLNPSRYLDALSRFTGKGIEDYGGVEDDLIGREITKQISPESNERSRLVIKLPFAVVMRAAVEGKLEVRYCPVIAERNRGERVIGLAGERAHELGFESAGHRLIEQQER